jgi:hypothetical protein
MAEPQIDVMDEGGPASIGAKYAVNPQTGQVVRDDGSGWKPVSSARNKQTGQIVIDDGSGWKQLVRSADGGWSLAGGAPTNPQASQAARSARAAIGAGLPVEQNDLANLTRPNIQPLTPAQQAYASTPQARLERQQFEDQRRGEIEQARVPDSDFKERSIMLMNGPSLGNGPRLAAGSATLGALLATPFVEGDIIDTEGVGGAAEKFLEDARVHQRRAREERPGESLGLEVIPAFFQGKSLLDMAGKHLLKKGTALNNTARVMGTGAVSGATYMGSQNESGTAQGVLQDAGAGALFGAGGGLLFKGAEAPARIAYRSAKTGLAGISDALSAALGRKGTARDDVAEQVAIAAVNRSADRAGLTMEQMLELVKKYEGKPAVLAEVIGQDAINALTALTRTLGKTSQKAQDIIEERSFGWYDRAKGDIEEATGIAPGQVDQIVEEGMEAGREKARPFYEELYGKFKTPKSFPESLKRVNRLLRSPGMERHKALAEKAIRNAAAKRSLPLSKMSKMEYFDLIKQSLDDAIDAAVAKGENRTRVGESVRDLVELKDEFVKELDRLTGGAYAAAREAGGEAPRLRKAAADGQKAFGARNPRVVEKTVQDTTEEALPALRAGMVDDLSTRIDKGSLIPGRFRRPDVAGKVRAVFGEDAGGKILEKMDAEATLRETGARWAPRLNSVTGTVMESGPTQMGDDLMNAGMNLMTGNKLGLLRQAINFARQRGFSQRQLDSIGDLLLSDPAEGLKRLGRMRPEGSPPAGVNALAKGAETSVEQAPAPQGVNALPAKTKQSVAMLPSVGGPNVGMITGGISGSLFPLPIDEDDTQAERWAKRGGLILAGSMMGRHMGKVRARLKDDLSKVHVFGDAPPAGALPKTQAGTSGLRPETAQQKDAIMGLLHMPQQQRAIFNTIEQQTGKIADKDVPAVIEMIETAAARGEAPEAIVRSGVDMMKSRGASGMGFVGGGDAANAVAGGLVGGLHPDIDQDGTVTMQERLTGVGAGMIGAPLAGRLLPGRAGAASAGVGGKPPKRPKIRKDVPVATKKRTDMPSLKGSIQKALDGASGMGAARATGDPRVVRTQAQNEAAEMLAAGARPADVHRRTGMVAIDTGEGSAFVYAPKNSIQEVQAAFWQEMAKPYSARQKWAQAAVGRTPPVGPGTVTGKPFETRAARAEEMLSGQKSPERIFEETGTIAIYRTDGRKLGNVGQNGAVAGSAKPAAVIDGSEFETYADAYKHLREIASKPLAEQPKWFREAVTDVPVTLDKSLSKPEVFLRKYGKTAARVTMPPAAMIGGAALAREVEKRREEARAQSSR